VQLERVGPDGTKRVAMSQLRHIMFRMARGELAASIYSWKTQAEIEAQMDIREEGNSKRNIGLRQPYLQH